MPLTQDQQARGYELRMEQIQTTIENMRFDMAAYQKQLDREARKFIVQAIVGGAACLAAGVALANYVNSRPAALTPARL